MKDLFADFKHDNMTIFVDPVMADNGKLYPAFDAAYVEIEDFSSPVQTNTPPTIAVIHDDMRIGEYLTYERTIATPINASAMYYNLWQHYQGKLVHLKSANAVIFTLE